LNPKQVFNWVVEVLVYKALTNKYTKYYLNFLSYKYLKFNFFMCIFVINKNKKGDSVFLHKTKSPFLLFEVMLLGNSFQRKQKHII
jgi:hypothetical protein